MNFSDCKVLGVINRTPNSFSDRGASLDSLYLKNQLQSFLKDPSLIVDVGFESTAPMNGPISSELERERFSLFLEESKSFDFKGRWISFDTYRPANFLFMAQAFRALHPETHFIFNDVSGVLDDELKEVLIECRSWEHFYYSYLFSHIPSRNHVLDHMKYLEKKRSITEEGTEKFKKACHWFERLGMEKNLLLDPGFGFSKTYQQNWTLLDEWGEWERGLWGLGIDAPLVIGLSKKSFLKRALEERGQGQDQLEELHRKCLENLQRSSGPQRHLLFRVHDPKVFSKGKSFP